MKTISSAECSDRLFFPDDTKFYPSNFRGIKIAYYTELLSGQIERDGKTVILTPEHHEYISKELNSLKRKQNDSVLASLLENHC